MGNTCKPMAVSFQCMSKFTTNKKKIFLIKNKNKLKKNCAYQSSITFHILLPQNLSQISCVGMVLGKLTNKVA